MSSKEIKKFEAQPGHGDHTPEVFVGTKIIQPRETLGIQMLAATREPDTSKRTANRDPGLISAEISRKNKLERKMSFYEKIGVRFFRDWIPTLGTKFSLFDRKKAPWRNTDGSFNKQKFLSFNRAAFWIHAIGAYVGVLGLISLGLAGVPMFVLPSVLNMVILVLNTYAAMVQRYTYLERQFKGQI